ncbi:hypothetical protein BDV36DRAFT_5189 [Aspergillus pseudocaelatus]|uniref:PNPLA domain-containing protein n=1 Tax=Aspergillus pseudocaelatus TaxID=1825620 RepID=A0ABQ6X0C6_9EURO|nr:hypothetical protein BDV36DRAFT_5189 [Aspergillus pseudocaelatus]
MSLRPVNRSMRNFSITRFKEEGYTFQLLPQGQPEQSTGIQSFPSVLLPAEFPGFSFVDGAIRPRQSAILHQTIRVRTFPMLALMKVVKYHENVPNTSGLTLCFFFSIFRFLPIMLAEILGHHAVVNCMVNSIIYMYRRRYPKSYKSHDILKP